MVTENQPLTKVEAAGRDSRGGVTLIDVFHLLARAPGGAAALPAGDGRGGHAPSAGFIGAGFHRSLGGEQVADYAQWESEADWRSMVRDGAVQARVGPIMAIATFQPKVYEPVSIHPAS